jgi:hypothetical protein
MGNRNAYVRRGTVLLMAMSTIAVLSVEADSAGKRVANIADQELFFGPVPKAVCGPGDKPEMALQGQVPIALRTQPGGFQGNSCNLQLIGQVRGEGANWQTTEMREGRGRNRKVCGYHGTSAPNQNPAKPRVNFGVRVLDISDPTKPMNTAYLNTTAMLDPWESLKVNERRKILGAVNGQNGGGGSEIDIYDISGDCRYPQLLSSVALSASGEFPGLIGHEGSWAPDGLTYYGMGGGGYFAVDTSNTLAPKAIANWRNPAPARGQHGLSISEDGNRGYYISGGNLTAATLLDLTVPATNGLVIYDLSEIQSRRPNPQPHAVGMVFWRDGSGAQHTIPIKVKGKPYVVFVDEGGSSGARQLGCPEGYTVYPIARIIDIADEKNPKVISKLILEAYEPKNCDQVNPDIVGLSSFLYGAHYCSVDNKRRATTLACGYFNSGIRVFDIRDPIRPREIAYYNPAATPDGSAGSNHYNQRTVQQPGGPDWCSAQVHMDADLGTLWTTCQDNGVLSLKFTHNAWPFAESTTPPGLQN